MIPMVKPGQKTKKKKFRRRASKKSRVYFTREKTSKQHCALCKGMLHGVPHGKTKTEVKRLSKTQRRPSTVFGGVLCTKCRTSAVEEAAKVKEKLKKIEDVNLEMRKYVETLLKNM